MREEQREEEEEGRRRRRGRGVERPTNCCRLPTRRVQEEPRGDAPERRTERAIERERERDIVCVEERERKGGGGGEEAAVTGIKPVSFI